MPFTIIRQDITKMQADAIVNAANGALQRGGGVCGAIFAAADGNKLQKACDKAAPVKTGGAAITPSFGLNARFIIHAVGPVYNAADEALCRNQLYAAYSNSLQLARKNRCSSIAFPLISSGIFGYPKDKALAVATQAIRDFLEQHDMDVYLCVFNRAAFVLSCDLLGDVESYIDDHYVDAAGESERSLLQSEREAFCQFCASPPAPQCAPTKLRGRRKSAQAPAAAPSMDQQSLDDWMRAQDEPFSAALLRLIDAKGKTDVEVYKRANIDRKLFSKIRNAKGSYTPKKATILALAVALELDLTETRTLLERAGYALSHASKLDLIVEYFIQAGNYDIFAINEVLFRYDQPLLGC